MSMSTIASAPVFASDNNDVQTFKIGICNYVDDASLNQIVSNIEKQLEKIEKDRKMFEIQMDDETSQRDQMAEDRKRLSKEFEMYGCA